MSRHARRRLLKELGIRATAADHAARSSALDALTARPEFRGRGPCTLNDRGSHVLVRWERARSKSRILLALGRS